MRPSGQVVEGKVVVDGDPVPEGTTVTVLARDGDESFVLDAEAEAELLESPGPVYSDRAFAA